MTSPVLIVTGPPGAGKTTASHLLAAGAPRGVHVRSDHFFDYVVGGFVEPWRPESHAQNTVVMEIVGRAAAGYADAGYLTVVDGIVIPGWFYEPLRDQLRAAGHAVAYAVLRPPLETCLARVAGRADGPLSDPAVVEQLYRAFSGLGELERHVVATDGQGPEDTAAALGALLRAGRLDASG